jgi:hypothetical protein
MINLEQIETNSTRVIHNGAVGVWRRPGVIVDVIRKEDVPPYTQSLMKGDAFIYVRFPELKDEFGRVLAVEGEGCYSQTELDLV